jgi:hypothetical protein
MIGSRKKGPIAALLLTLILAAASAFAQATHTSKPFAGPKANKGTVTHSKVGSKSVLTLSDDFVVPDTPDPHWRVVDSKGTVYDLAKLKIKNDGYNKSVTLPSYIKDVKKVIIWCAWAEANLGEAEFDQPVK